MGDKIYKYLKWQPKAHMEDLCWWHILIFFFPWQYLKKNEWLGSSMEHKILIQIKINMLKKLISQIELMKIVPFL